MAQLVLHGIAVSAGIAIGRAFFVDRRGTRTVPHATVPVDQVEAEVGRLAAAFEEERAGLALARDSVPMELKEHAAIINTHLMISQDPKLKDKSLKKIRELGIGAEWALGQAIDELEAAFEAIEDPYIRERIQDVHVVSGRILARLQGRVRDRNMREIKGRVVLMAHNLSPADTVSLEVGSIMSFATEMGGRTSHTGILARSLQIPAVVGVTGLEAGVADSQLVIIDGLKGKVLVGPDEVELAYYTDLTEQFNAYQASIMRECSLPGETIDGYRVGVLTNIERFEEVTAVLDNGGEGIGLYRTEYSFLNRKELPTEEELTEEYTDIAAIMSPRRVVFRSLDLGADKLSNFFGGLEESNPALGLRAIRFCLQHEELFRMQLRAILRASIYPNVAPSMVTIVKVFLVYPLKDVPKYPVY